MDEKVDVLTGKVSGMEETVHTISTMEDATAEYVAKLDDKVRTI